MSAPASEQESAYGVAVPVPAPAPRLAPATPSRDMAVGTWPVAKRTLDLLLALLGVIAFAPVMLVIAALIKLDTRGPVLFRQRRYGLHQKTFTVLKFRTMSVGASEDAHRRYIAELAAAGETGAGLKKLTSDA